MRLCFTVDNLCLKRYLKMNWNVGRVHIQQSRGSREHRKGRYFCGSNQVNGVSWPTLFFHLHRLRASLQLCCLPFSRFKVNDALPSKDFARPHPLGILEIFFFSLFFLLFFFFRERYVYCLVSCTPTFQKKGIQIFSNLKKRREYL